MSRQVFQCINHNRPGVHAPVSIIRDEGRCVCGAWYQCVFDSAFDSDLPGMTDAELMDEAVDSYLMAWVTPSDAAAKSDAWKRRNRACEYEAERRMLAPVN